MLEADGYLAGSVMVGYDGHRGWVNYLAVDPAWQGRGLGRMLMDEAEQRLLALGCPKVNLQVRTSNEHVVAFYRHLGYGTDDVVSMGKRRAHTEDMGRIIGIILGAILAIWLAVTAAGGIFATLKTFLIIGLIAMAVFIVVWLVARGARRG